MDKQRGTRKKLGEDLQALEEKLRSIAATQDVRSVKSLSSRKVSSTSFNRSRAERVPGCCNINLAGDTNGGSKAQDNWIMRMQKQSVEKGCQSQVRGTWIQRFAFPIEKECGISYISNVRIHVCSDIEMLGYGISRGLSGMNIGGNLGANTDACISLSPKQVLGIDISEF